ncbi:MAG: hypothetical protein KDD82_00650, partial [Planctomycetes bacterium]|nr:hypothetical protein [Planctomycetota bacterium]
MSESEVLAMVQASFPHLGGPDCRGRVEGVGIYAASGWSVGRDTLAQLGLNIPPQVYDALTPRAAEVNRSRSGGLDFLTQLHAGCGSAAFHQLLHSLVHLYTQAFA